MSRMPGNHRMAFAKSRKRGNQQNKSLGDMCRKPTSSLGSIMEISLSDQRQYQRVNASHDLSAVANGQARGIFFQGDIAPIMGTGFNAPMRAANFQQAFWRCFCSRQTGKAKFDFMGEAITFSIAPSLKLAFQTIYLRQARPT